MHTVAKTLLALATALTLAFAAGCSGTSEGSAPADPLLRTCSGTFTCRADGSSSAVQSTLNASNGSCHAGGLRLDADHTVYDEEDGTSGATWTGDLDAFSICVDGSSACLRCVNNARLAETQSAEAPATTGKCIGTPKACVGRASADCFPETGCNWSPSLGDCSDSTRPTTACGDLVVADRCAKHGCSWMPDEK